MNVVALGSFDELGGLVLAGVRLVAVETDEEAGAAWQTLDDDVGLVILSPAAAAALGDRCDERPQTLTVVTP